MHLALEPLGLPSLLNPTLPPKITLGAPNPPPLPPHHPSSNLDIWHKVDKIPRECNPANCFSKGSGVRDASGCSISPIWNISSNSCPTHTPTSNLKHVTALLRRCTTFWRRCYRLLRLCDDVGMSLYDSATALLQRCTMLLRRYIMLLCRKRRNRHVFITKRHSMKGQPRTRDWRELITIETNGFDQPRFGCWIDG